MSKQFTLHIEQDGNRFIGEIKELPSCYTQAPSIGQLLERMIEVTKGSIQLSNELLGSNFPHNFNVAIDISYAAS